MLVMFHVNENIRFLVMGGIVGGLQRIYLKLVWFFWLTYLLQIVWFYLKFYAFQSFYILNIFLRQTFEGILVIYRQGELNYNTKLHKSIQNTLQFIYTIGKPAQTVIEKSFTSYHWWQKVIYDSGVTVINVCITNIF